MKYRIQIDGMHCEGCAKSLYKKITALKGVQKAVINIINRDAVVETTVDVTKEALQYVVVATGFDVESIVVIEE